MTIQTTIIPQTVNVDEETIIENVDGTISVGDISSKTNDVLIIYTSNAFDSSRSGSGGTTSNSYEPAAISASDLTGATYLRIRSTFTANATTNTTNGTRANANLKIEEKFVGDSYSTIFDKEVLVSDATGGSMGLGETITTTIEYLYTLTANDLANGVQLKFTSTSGTQGNNESSSFSNIQTIVERIMY